MEKKILEKTERMILDAIEPVVSLYVNEVYTGILFADSYTLNKKKDKTEIRFYLGDTNTFYTQCDSCKIIHEVCNNWEFHLLKRCS